jgi:hypothetical protein
MQTWSRQDDSRYVDHASSARAGIVLFDLLARMNETDRTIADEAIAHASQERIDALSSERPLSKLNTIMKTAGLPLVLRVDAEGAFHAQHTQRGSDYPINTMSDGEKSALLLAAEVLTAPLNCVLIIDEPERHLHRSISSVLVEAVIAMRPDCHFMILTHDLELAQALEKSESATYVVLNSTWIGGRPSSWDIRAIESYEGFGSDQVRRAILGGRSNLLFVEGQQASLDTRLFGILYPNWTVAGVGGADNVTRAVAGVRASTGHHWINAYGAVDGDDRDASEKLALAAKGVSVLAVHEVENIYYSSKVLEAAAGRQERQLGRTPGEMLQDARSKMLQTFDDPELVKRMAQKLAVTAIRRRVFQDLPSIDEISSETVEISFPSPYDRILAEIQLLVSNQDLDGLITRLPIRDTSIRAVAARALGYQSATDYESAVNVYVSSNTEAQSAIREIVDPSNILE